MNNNTLYLPLKKEWYQLIEKGIKLEDYRKMNDYWFKRLSNKEYKYVRFSYGYTKRTMTFECKGIVWDTGNPEWGAEPGEVYFIIKLGRRLK